MLMMHIRSTQRNLAVHLKIILSCQFNIVVNSFKTNTSVAVLKKRQSVLTFHLTECSLFTTGEDGAHALSIRLSTGAAIISKWKFLRAALISRSPVVLLCQWAWPSNSLWREVRLNNTLCEGSNPRHASEQLLQWSLSIHSPPVAPGVAFKLGRSRGSIWSRSMLL